MCRRSPGDRQPAALAQNERSHDCGYHHLLGTAPGRYLVGRYLALRVQLGINALVCLGDHIREQLSRLLGADVDGYGLQTRTEHCADGSCRVLTPYLRPSTTLRLPPIPSITAWASPFEADQARSSSRSGWVRLGRLLVQIVNRRSLPGWRVSGTEQTPSTT